jgi:integrase
MVKLKYIQKIRYKQKVYYFFRRRGLRVRLPDNPDSPEFTKAYWEARQGGPKKVKTTFNALIISYYQSPRFSKLKESTKKEYHRGLEFLREKNGPKDFTKLRRRDVIAARDKYADTWRKANGMVENISILAKHAIDLEWITNNPAQGVEKLKGGSYEAWPDEMLRAYEDHCREHDLTLELTLYELALGTGQRIGDVCVMRWDQFDDEGFMTVLQEKTGTLVEVYCPQRLQDHLALLPRDGEFILGRISKRRAQNRIQLVRKAIGAEKFVPHGWRYTAAKELAEAGATDAEIQSVTGHRTLEMAQKYRGQAERKRLSKAAQKRRTN